MFNVKYIIDRDPETSMPRAQINTDRFGPVWLVDSIVAVNSVNEELLGLGRYDLANTALVYTDQFDQFPDWPRPINHDKDSIDATNTDKIQLIAHRPDRLVYRSNTTQERIAVFSEAYYPYGWQVTIDGQQADVFRANYVLRSLIIPAGDHEIIFEFIPEVVRTGELITLSSTALLVLVVLIMLLIQYRKHPLVRQ